MNSLDFRQDSAAIRYLGEGRRKRRFNWDRWVYIIFLMVFFGALGHYVYQKTFFIRANGQVTFENIEIRLPEDSRIMEYMVSEDDTVTAGDTLFRYFPHSTIRLAKEIREAQKPEETQTPHWMEQERYNLEKKILLNKIDRQKATEKLTGLKGELKHLENAMMLDVLSHDRYEAARTEVARLEAEIAKIDAENAQNKKLMGTLHAPTPKILKAKSKEGGGSQVDAPRDSTEGETCFLAPVNGFVTRLFTNQFELALKEDVIMSIHSERPMFIKAFFDQEDIAHFNIGDEVDISFPDGRKSKGYVKRFNYSTFQLPSEFQKRYDPVTRTVAADIYPVNESDYTMWRGFYRMSATISKRKNPF